MSTKFPTGEEMKKQKGYALVPPTTLMLLTIIGIIAFIFIIGIANYFDVKTIIRETQTERHAIDLAQAIISSEKITYQRDNHFYRAVFDEKKLDAVFDTSFLQPNGQLGIAYPNSATNVAIKDLVTEKTWVATVYGPLTAKTLTPVDFSNCLANSAKFVEKYDLKSIVEQIFRFAGTPVGLSLWDKYDLEKCTEKFKSSTGEKLASLIASGSPVTTRGFPVTIRSGNEVHLGLIKVGAIEF